MQQETLTGKNQLVLFLWTTTFSVTVGKLKNKGDKLTIRPCKVDFLLCVNLKKNGEARYNLFAVEMKVRSEIICTKNLDKPPIFF